MDNKIPPIQFEEDPVAALTPWEEQGFPQYDLFMKKQDQFIKNTCSIRKSASLPQRLSENDLEASVNRLSRHKRRFKSRAISNVESVSDLRIYESSHSSQRKNENQNFKQIQKLKGQNPVLGKLFEAIRQHKEAELFVSTVLKKKVNNKNPMKYFGKIVNKKSDASIIRKKSEMKIKFEPKIPVSYAYSKPAKFDSLVSPHKSCTRMSPVVQKNYIGYSAKKKQEENLMKSKTIRIKKQDSQRKNILQINFQK